ncbi:MAG: diacylglycerol kinase family protein [Solirubrobacterales bacterium]
MRSASRIRLAAFAALILGALTVAAAAYSAIANFPRGLVIAALLIGAAAAAWYGLLRRGAARVAGLGGAVVLVLACLLVVILDGGVWDAIVIAAAALAAMTAAKAAVAVHVTLAEARPPLRPVLFYNPKSGGGKAQRFHLPDEARARGIEPIELRPGDDLWDLVRGAVDGGADGLAMAGGDGSQAVVAAIASSTTSPTPAYRRAPATISRSTPGSTATTWSVRSTHSSTEASASSTSPR